MALLLPIGIVVAGVAVIVVIASWKVRGAPSVRRRLAAVAPGRKPRRIEGTIAGGRYSGVLALFDDELVFAQMNVGDQVTRVPLGALTDITQIRAVDSFRQGDGSYQPGGVVGAALAPPPVEWMLKVEWKVGDARSTGAWPVRDIDAWIAALAAARP